MIQTRNERVMATTVCERQLGNLPLRECSTCVEETVVVASFTGGGGAADLTSVAAAF